LTDPAFRPIAAEIATRSDSDPNDRREALAGGQARSKP